MGLLEPITHKKEIEELIESAQRTYNVAKEDFDKQKERTTKQLERLGKVKIKAWANGMDGFVENFSAFNNIEVVQAVGNNMSFIGSNVEPKQMIINIKNASLTAGEVKRVGVAAIGTGALVGIASYGGAMMFGTASTGTAIAALSGAAKTNATLAWFGGGAKAVGGLGIAGGKLVLAGVVAAPVLAVAALITNAKAKEKLAEAKKIHEEAKNAAAQMNTMTTGMAGVETMADNYTRFIKKLDKKFKPFIKELSRIRQAHPVTNGALIDFNDLNVVEQKTLHLTWLMAQIYYHALSTAILTHNGEVSPEAVQVLNESKREFAQYRRDTFKINGEEAEAANLFWKGPARLMAVLNSIVMAMLVFVGVKTITSRILLGILDIIGAIIAFPFFIKFKNLPASKLYMWRIVRLVVGVVFVVVMNCILR